MIGLGTASLLYDAATGGPAKAAFTASMAQFGQVNGGPIACLAWSPDGTRLAFGFAEHGQVLLMETSGSQLALRTVHSGWVRSLAFSPDGTRLATCSRDRTVKLLDARTLELLLVFKEHRADVRALAWSPDGRALWSADVEGNAIMRSLPAAVGERQEVGGTIIGLPLAGKSDDPSGPGFPFNSRDRRDPGFPEHFLPSIPHAFSSGKVLSKKCALPRHPRRQMAWTRGVTLSLAIHLP